MDEPVVGEPTATTLDPIKDVVVPPTKEEEQIQTNIDVPVTNNDSEEARENVEDKEEEGKNDTGKPLLEEDSVRIEIQPDNEGEDTPTLPLPDKKRKQKEGSGGENIPPPMYLFPVTRLKLAWEKASSVPEFLVRALCIIFTSLGWLLCIGGFPFVSLAMMIMGSVYISECPASPNIPVYLVVAGTFGTIQHLFAIWIRYVPRDSKGILGRQRKNCLCVDFILQAFLAVWFITGCVWVYSKEVQFNEELPDYCHKAVYLFTFWIFNITFIVIAILFTTAFCLVICISTSPKKEGN